MGKKAKNGQSNTALKEKTSSKLKQPHKYDVIMYNDDFTPMDFVVALLEQVFHKDEQMAVELMLTIHKTGQAKIGTYTYDIAATKQAQSMRYAQEAGYPLRVELKEV